LLEQGATTQRVTAEPLAYARGSSRGNKFDAAIKTSLAERFAIDSRYTYQRNLQGSGESAASLADSASHTAALKVTWNISDNLSWTLSGACAKTTDHLAATPVYYTLTPGTGLIYRLGDKFRLDLDWTYARSFAGQVTEVTDCALRARYCLNDQLNVTLRAEQQVSRSPDYRLTDISGNIEINL